MSTTTKKDIVRGKRYSADEKAKVVAFVNEHNSANGRGGQSAAAAKFGISQLTIATWLKRAGGASTKTTKSSAVKGGITNKLNALQSLGSDIDKLEKELAAKRAKFDAIKVTL